MPLLDFSDEEEETALLCNEPKKRRPAAKSLLKVLDDTSSQRPQRRQESSGPTVRKVPLSKNKQPAFLRWVGKSSGKLIMYDAEMPGLQGINEMKIRFQPISLGISYRGNIITNVTSGSQADITGVKKSWQIIAVNGKIMPNNSITIQKAIHELNIQKNMVDILFLTITPDIRKVVFQTKLPIGINYKGNRITDPVPSSQADKAGILKNWTIVAINNKNMPNNSTIIQRTIYEATQQGDTLVISFRISDRNSIPIDRRKKRSNTQKHMQINENRNDTSPRSSFSEYDRRDSFLRSMSKYIFQRKKRDPSNGHAYTLTQQS